MSAPADMDAGEPLVTIGMPVYNGERFLREALDSVLAQTWRRFLLRISDNGSTDSTPAICAEYARRDSRIDYRRRDTNRGAVWNFNELARGAATPYFAWHAADDRAAPGHLEACLAAFEQRPAAVLAYVRAESIDSRGHALPGNQPRLALGSERVSERFAACLAPIPYAENATYGLMKTDVLQQTRLFGVFGGSDRAFLAEFSLYGPFARVEQVLFQRRVPDATRAETEVQRYNTAGRSRFSLREWRILAWNLRSIRRAPRPLEGRARLYGLVLRRLLKHSNLYISELTVALKGLASQN
ncbi:MAG: glycosyltransferase family 2 protein [Steroidobacterales bacterium]